MLIRVKKKYTTWKKKQKTKKPKKTDKIYETADGWIHEVIPKTKEISFV